MEVDAKAKFDAGIISEREYHLVVAFGRNADRDSGLT